MFEEEETFRVDWLILLILLMMRIMIDVQSFDKEIGMGRVHTAFLGEFVRNGIL